MPHESITTNSKQRNKEHAGWEWSKLSRLGGSQYWGWGWGSSSKNSHIHNFKLVTIQKMKFKREPQSLSSCSLVNWTAGGAPNDLQFNLNYVILLHLGNQNRGASSPQGKACRVASWLCLHRAVSEFEWIKLQFVSFLEVTIFLFVFKIVLPCVSFKFHFNNTNEGLIRIKLFPLRSGVPSQIKLEGRVCLRQERVTRGDPGQVWNEAEYLRKHWKLYEECVNLDRLFEFLRDRGYKEHTQRKQKQLCDGCYTFRSCNYMRSWFITVSFHQWNVRGEIHVWPCQRRDCF